MMMKNKILVNILYAIILSLILTVCINAQSPESPLATVIAIQGKVEIKKIDGEWQKATRGAILEIGDFIRTGANSTATVEMTNAEEVISIKISEETEASVEDLLVSSLSGKQDSKIKLKKGHINVTTKKFDNKTLFKTETPNAIVELGKYGVVVRYKE